MSDPLETLVDTASLSRRVERWRGAGQRVALVPTMGDLHDGHLGLVEVAKENADRVVVSIFVNPLQFGPSEDFERYPRDLANDQKKLLAVGADALFAPHVNEVYPDGIHAAPAYDTGELGRILCGSSRPGHFDGVATVVGRLFDLVRPDCAVFGKKDYQQLLVVRHLVAVRQDDIEIIGAAILREVDGLAMSSRNRYLDTDQRRTAPALFKLMRQAADAIAADPESAGQVLSRSESDLAAAGFEPEYLTLRRASDLAPPAVDDTELILLAAARLGDTRLIDNLLFSL